jgi:hypothetical protein
MDVYQDQEKVEKYIARMGIEWKPLFYLTIGVGGTYRYIHIDI